MKNIELAKTYEPAAFEEDLYRFWEESGAFKPDGRPHAEPFVMVIPPPNVTGVLHIGHGLNNSLQDILTRYWRMQGKAALWVPGTDHAGIATQFVVEKQLRERGLTRQEMGREAFVREVWKAKEKHHAIIVNQLKKMGCSCDWSRERFTLDDGLSQAVREVFVALYEHGLIYKGEYLINWCSQCGTAIADDEVEYIEEEGALYYVRYPLAEGGEIIVATSRPETIFGDTAIAVNPDDPRYKGLAGKRAKVPLEGREIPIIADSYVDMEFGTAALKVTPGHDINDFEIGRRHQLPLINILTPQGLLNAQVPQAFQGLAVIQARKAVAAALQEAGLLVKTEKLAHRVGRCYRCGTIIEPLLSKQWFVKMQPLAEKAMQALEDKEICFYPARWANTYTHWMKNIRDWCISRQLWWGHRIPAWQCEACGHITVSRHTPQNCAKCGSSELEQDEDVLDTWFSSWLWPFSILGWPHKTPDLARFYPSTAVVTGYDIIFFWIARMVIAGKEFTGQAPFKDIYITPLVRDKQGRKMSKSLGNGIDPLEIIAEEGADALRFTLAYLSSQGQDLPLDKQTFKIGLKFANKIWNASRYLLMNLEGVQLVKEPALNDADRWLRRRLSQTAAEVSKAIASYRFDDMAHAVYRFFWDDFCDWYIEASKLSLYSASQTEKNRAVSAALNFLEESLRLLHPFLPFITEEIYQKLPNKKYPILINAPYPKELNHEEDVLAGQRFALLQAAVSSLRALRSSAGVPPEKKARAALLADKDLPEKAWLEQQEELLKALAKAQSVSFIADKGAAQGAAGAAGPGFSAYIFASDFLDAAAERAKAAKELAKAQALQMAAESKLANANFISRAAPEAVAKEKAKLEQAKAAAQKWAAYQRSLDA